MVFDALMYRYSSCKLYFFRNSNTSVKLTVQVQNCRKSHSHLYTSVAHLQWEVYNQRSSLIVQSFLHLHWNASCSGFKVQSGPKVYTQHTI